MGKIVFIKSELHGTRIAPQRLPLARRRAAERPGSEESGLFLLALSQLATAVSK